MPQIPDSVAGLARDLQTIFGARLHSVVMYGTEDDHHPHADGHHGHRHHARVRLLHTLALVEALGIDDLRACARRAEAWHAAGLDTPLVLARREFERSLDAFPLEFGAILRHHVVVVGQAPFEALAIEAADLGRACEVQARSHLLHLREGFIETRGRADALAVLIVQSASPLAALLRAVARLQRSDALDSAAAARHVERLLGLDSGILEQVVRLAGVTEIPSAEATALFPAYLDASERLVAFVDSRSHAA